MGGARVSLALWVHATHFILVLFLLVILLYSIWTTANLLSPTLYWKLTVQWRNDSWQLTMALSPGSLCHTGAHPGLRRAAPAELVGITCVWKWCWPLSLDFWIFFFRESIFYCIFPLLFIPPYSLPPPPTSIPSSFWIFKRS